MTNPINFPQFTTPIDATQFANNPVRQNPLLNNATQYNANGLNNIGNMLGGNSYDPTDAVGRIANVTNQMNNYNSKVSDAKQSADFQTGQTQLKNELSEGISKGIQATQKKMGDEIKQLFSN